MRYLAGIVAFLALLAAVDPALARRDRDRDNWDRGGHEYRSERPSLDRFLPDIRRQHPGRLLDVEPRSGRNRIKWLTPDGRVIWLDTDARTGQIYGVEGDEPGRHRE